MLFAWIPLKYWNISHVFMCYTFFWFKMLEDAFQWEFCSQFVELCRDSWIWRLNGKLALSHSNSECSNWILNRIIIKTNIFHCSSSWFIAFRNRNIGFCLPATTKTSRTKYKKSKKKRFLDVEKNRNVFSLARSYYC